MSLKSVWAAIDRESIPYPQIVDKLPPADWEFIFRGERSEPSKSLSLEDALRYLFSQGFRCTLEPLGGQGPTHEV